LRFEGCSGYFVSNRFYIRVSKLEANEQQRELLKKVEKMGKVSHLRFVLTKQAEMDDVCDVLKQYGTVYYDEMEDCPELLKLGLLERDNSKNDLVPPRKPGDKYSWKEGLAEQETLIEKSKVAEMGNRIMSLVESLQR
jgi:hypothetical protein